MKIIRCTDVDVIFLNTEKNVLFTKELSRKVNYAAISKMQTKIMMLTMFLIDLNKQRINKKLKP